MFDNNEKMFTLIDRDTAIDNSRPLLEKCIPYQQKIEHNIGGDDYQPGKRVKGYENLKIERG